VPRLTIATCQFPVTSDPARNARWILRQMHLARKRGAHVAHFPECALSGYAGPDLDSYAGYDWDALRAACEQVLTLARELRLWVVVGSAHRLSGKHKPHNSLYVVDDRGELVERYDKRFCAGDHRARTGDLAHFTPGNHLTVFDLRGLRCGAQICHDYRYPELYRDAKRASVELMFHSFHAGGISAANYKSMQAQVGRSFARINPGSTLPEITMPAAMITAAADNHMWISCANSSRKNSCWGAFSVRPDGVIATRLRKQVPGVLVTEIDTRARYYDSTAAWRDRAMAGQLYSGRLVCDPRSAHRRRP
jgi:deaminated glutathione amidase